MYLPSGKMNVFCTERSLLVAKREALQSLAEFDLFISTLVLPDNEAVSEAGGPFFSAKPTLPPNQAFREPNCSRNQEKRTLKNVDCFVVSFGNNFEI